MIICYKKRMMSRIDEEMCEPRVRRRKPVNWGMGDGKGTLPYVKNVIEKGKEEEKSIKMKTLYNFKIQLLLNQVGKEKRKRHTAFDKK